ncbi:outer membrane lipoprotein-sorting protein [Fontimonas sp. SYSU GA230001]|uniref:outer membrane lipoprotein-sorting protein n=1 Tax=Fontimonas sp. SYSU GA230001 TaxID=3142450 RepID=UPI0032B37103
MNLTRWSIVAALCLGLGTTAALADEALDQVVACMRANIPKTLQIKEIALTATDRTGGVRELRGRLYAMREDERLRAMVKIASPADLAGAAYLLREKSDGDEMYVYVPALQKVRRITGVGVDGMLWGTDLSYGDIKQLNNAFAAGQTRLDGRGDLAGRPVHLLTSLPAPGEVSRFTQTRIWVDQKTCVGLRADFYEGDTVRKRLDVEPASLRQSGPHWYPGEALMSDLKEGTKTRLRVLGLSSDVDLPGRHFNPSTFYIGS